MARPTDPHDLPPSSRSETAPDGAAAPPTAPHAGPSATDVRPPAESPVAAAVPAAESPPAVEPQLLAAEADILPAGTGLGKYRILERFRTGRHAHLYRARDVLLDRLVIIKQLAPPLADNPRACGRFRKEAHLLAQVPPDARYVIAIHELIEERRGLFLVTEHVPGPTLDALIAKRQLSLQSALEILARLCLAIRSLHHAGVVLRGLSPRDIIVDPAGRPKITNLTAAATDGSESDVAALDPGYAAPELLAQEPCDDRVDLYALGVVALEMLAGRAAFSEFVRRTITNPSDPAAWRRWHESGASDWPEAHDLNPQVPPVLSAIVGRMNARDPDARFGAIEDVIALLVKHFARHPTRGALVRFAAPLHEPPEAAPLPEVRALPLVPPPPPPTTAASAAAPTTTIPIHTAYGGAGAVFEPLRPFAAKASVDVALPPRPVPPLAVIRISEAGEDSPARRRIRARRRRTVRRFGLAAAIVASVSAGLYGARALFPVAFGNGHEKIETLLVDARRALDQGEFRAAVEQLRKAERIPVRGLKMYNVHADVLRWLALAEAQFAMRSGNLDLAENKLREATNRGMERDLVNPVRRELIKAQSARRLQEHLGEGGLSAEQIDPGWVAPGETVPAASPTPPEPTEPTDAGGDAGPALGATAKSEREFRAAFSAVEDALKRGDYDDAIEGLKRLMAMRQTAEVDDLTVRVYSAQQRDAVITAAESAMSTGDYEEAVRHYREAIRLESSAEIQQKLNRAIALSLLAEGRAEFDNGNVAVASQKFRAAQWRDPACGAAAELRRIQPAVEAVEMVRRGDAAAADGNWAEAVDFYRDAVADLPVAVRDEVRRKLVEAREQSAASADKAPDGDAQNPSEAPESE